MHPTHIPGYQMRAIILGGKTFPTDDRDLLGWKTPVWLNPSHNTNASPGRRPEVLSSQNRTWRQARRERQIRWVDSETSGTCQTRTGMSKGGSNRRDCNDPLAPWRHYHTVHQRRETSTAQVHCPDTLYGAHAWVRSSECMDRRECRRPWSDGRLVSPPRTSNRQTLTSTKSGSEIR